VQSISKRLTCTGKIFKQLILLFLLLLLHLPVLLKLPNNVWCNENRTKALVKHYCAWFDFYCIRRYKGAGKTHFYLGNPMMHGSFLNRRLFKVSAGKILFKDIILCSRQILVSPPPHNGLAPTPAPLSIELAARKCTIDPRSTLAPCTNCNGVEGEWNKAQVSISFRPVLPICLLSRV
jgi:hypothetical protein